MEKSIHERGNLFHIWILPIHHDYHARHVLEERCECFLGLQFFQRLFHSNDLQIYKFHFFICIGFNSDKHLFCCWSINQIVLMLNGNLDDENGVEIVVLS